MSRQGVACCYDQAVSLQTIMNIYYIALKNLTRKPIRTSLLLAIVAVVSCTLFSATLFLKSVNNALMTGTYRLGADVLVVPESAEQATRTALLSGQPTHFLMPRAVLDKVRAVEGVKSATPQIFITPLAFSCCYDVDVFLIAFDPETDFTVKPWLEKNLRKGLGLDEVITGHDIPVFVGDPIPFYGTVFHVAGTMEATGMDFFDRAVFMSMDAGYKMAKDSAKKAVQKLEIKQDQISTVLVQVRDDVTPEMVAIRIEHDIKGIKALVADTVISTVRRQLTGLIKAILVIGVVLWLIVLLIMSFAFTMIVNERRRELGLLMAVGAARGHIARIILSEAGLLSVVGGVVGVLTGVAIIGLLRDAILHYLKLPYLFPAVGELTLLWAGAILLSLCTGLLSALLPVSSVLKHEPYDAIKREE